MSRTHTRALARVLAAGTMAIGLALGGTLVAAGAANAATTDPVVLLGAPGAAEGFIPLGGSTYLTGYAAGNYGLFSTDGTSYTPVAGSPIDAHHLVKLGDVLYFSGQDPVSFDYGVYSFDGTTITAVATPTNFIREIVVSNNTVYIADDNTIYTLAPGGLQPVSGSLVRAAQLTDYNGALYFSAAPDNQSDAVLYRLDSLTTTAVVGSPLYPSELVVANGLLYFLGSGPAGLFSTDGVTATLVPGSPAYFTDLTAVGTSLYMVAQGADDNVLVQYNGATFAEVANSPANPESLAAFDGTLFFAANRTLMSYGTAGFRQFGTPPFNPNGLGVFGGNLYFSAELVQGSEVNELWVIRTAAVVDPAVIPAATDPAATLAATGSDSTPTIVAAALFLSAGLGGVILARRRRIRAGALETSRL